MTQEAANSNRTHKILWIVLALLTVSLIGSVSLLLLWLRAPKPATSTRTTTASEPSATTPPARDSAASFAELSETSVPGRYRIADDGGKIMYVVLNEDHTFINEDGTTYLPYQWDVSPAGLTITW